MRRPRCPGALATLASLLLAPPVLAQTAETKAKEATLPPPADARHQLTSGVIIKAEPITRSGAPANDPAETPRFLRLTINTAAVWRDWVRDQATMDPKSPRAAAVQGQKSVATTGEPQSANTTVVVVVAPDTTVQTRYRSATDEVSEGSPTPAKAARAEAKADPADTSTPRVDHSAAKPPKFTVEDLKPGLWVEVQYRDAKTRERATLVRVMRPVGGPQTPAADEKPATAPK